MNVMKRTNASTAIATRYETGREELLDISIDLASKYEDSDSVLRICALDRLLLSSLRSFGSLELQNARTWKTYWRVSQVLLAAVVDI